MTDYLTEEAKRLEALIPRIAAQIEQAKQNHAMAMGALLEIRNLIAKRDAEEKQKGRVVDAKKVKKRAETKPS